MTATAVGVADVSTPFSSSPFTWTLTVQPVRGSVKTFERDFFLGTPPFLPLNSTDTQACALFFDGISANLKFPGSDPETDQGTCIDALTQACVDDLSKQAKDAWSELLDGSESDDVDLLNTGEVCKRFGETLRDHAPQTCTAASDRKWGDILARPLTGASAPEPVKKGTCNPTTGRDYDLRQVASRQVETADRTTSDLAKVSWGVTPIVTIFYGGEQLQEGQSRVELSCLKTIGAAKGNAPAKGEAENSAKAVVATVWTGYAGVIAVAAIALIEVL